MATTGVRMDEVGDMYDFALGYADPTSGNTQMYGYVLAPTSGFQEVTNMQDDQHIVQIASANQTDRFERYPKVSQGDWSGGERQLILTDPTKYYQSNGVETSKPGQLTLLGPAVQQFTSSSVIGRTLETDGQNWFYGGFDGLGDDIVCNGTLTHIGTGNGFVTYMFRCPLGVFAYMAGTGGVAGIQGLWQIIVTGTNSTTTSTQWTVADSPEAIQQAAYYNGLFYFIGPTNQLYSVATAGGALTVVTTTPASDRALQIVASAANGLLLATTERHPTGLFPTSPCGMAVLYTFDGVTRSKIWEVQGAIKWIHTLNNISYILVEHDQLSTTFNLALYQLSGSTITQIFDERFVLPDFQPNCPSPIFQANSNMSDDGRFLYISSPGMYGLRFDPTNGALTRIGGDGSPGAVSHQLHAQVWTSPLGVVDAVVSGPTGGTVTINSYAAAGTATSTGTLTTSYYDFGTPTTNKAFRSIEFDLQTAYTAGHIGVQYRTDNNTAWNTLTVQQGGTGNSAVAYLPAGVKGFRIQFLITLTTVGGVVPVVRSYAAKANLGRIWKVTPACRRDQQMYSGIKDSQNVSSMDRLANIINAYKLTAGQCVLYIPDPTAAPTATTPQGVSQVNALIQDYEWDTAPGVSPALKDGPDGQRDMEGDVTLTLVEQL